MRKMGTLEWELPRRPESAPSPESTESSSTCSPEATASAATDFSLLVASRPRMETVAWTPAGEVADSQVLAASAAFSARAAARKAFGSGSPRRMK